MFLLIYFGKKNDHSYWIKMDPIEQILSMHIPCGLYRDEDRASWKPFLTKVDSIVKDNDHPRNTLIKLWQEDHQVV